MPERIIFKNVLPIFLFGTTLAFPDFRITDDLPSSTALSSNGGRTCVYESCLKSAAKLLTNIDTNTNPCDDFYQFACGRFIKNIDIPDDEKSIDRLTMVRRDLRKEMSFEMNSTLYNEPWHMKLLKTFYSSCIKSTLFEKENMLFLSRLNVLNDWPVLKGDEWNEDNFDWKHLINILGNHGFDIDFFFDLSVTINQKNPDEYIMTLDRPVVGILEEYLTGSEYMNIYQKAYTDYLINVAVQLGADKSIAITDFEEMLLFMGDIIRISLSDKERRNLSRLYNKMCIGSLITQYPDMFSLDLFNKLFNSTHNVTLKDKIIVKDLNYINDINIILRTISRRVLANYMYWKIIIPLVPFLSEDLRIIHYKYINAISGQVDMERIADRCVRMARNYIPLAFGAVYIRYVNPGTPKDDINEIIENMKTQFQKIIKRHKWVDNESKVYILSKLDSLIFKVNNPLEFYNNAILADYYEKLNFSSNFFMKQLLEINVFRKKKLAEMLTIKVDINAWYNQKYTGYVNAFYYYDRNQIELPAAIIQKEFLDSYRPHYLNYGSIGYVIGHEMLHAFDDLGRQFDHTGRLMSWWSPNTTYNFDMKAKCFDEQYSNYAIKGLRTNVDGSKTLNENIADNGGVRVAYLAYQELMKANSEKINFAPEESLPGVNYTSNQLFWISYASHHCTKFHHRELHNAVMGDSHALPEFRVNGVVRNMEEFANDFECPLDSKMNPRNKCLLW